MIKWNSVWIGYDKVHGFFIQLSFGSSPKFIHKDGTVVDDTLDSWYEDLDEVRLAIKIFKEKQFPIKKQLWEKQIKMIQEKIDNYLNSETEKENK